MRLLEHTSGDEFVLAEDFIGNDKVPPYAILSHTWKDGQEVTFSEFTDGTGKSKTGYEKIRFCGQQAKRDGLRHFWNTSHVRRQTASYPAAWPPRPRSNACCAPSPLPRLQHARQAAPDDGDTVNYDITLTICGIISNN
ncbi:hypothetical protein DM02DRAFT_663785 [Periconia macrospinosa]|uniref:Uncharacterized protein n=1 Tax=Periconia macrospinosa TaxID=97972 RepID=A0A2V1D0V1_9PLEO|nr:hypothetical protein DM02DRAFT_663785 [Periconia macrospinosa]